MISYRSTITLLPCSLFISSAKEDKIKSSISRLSPLSRQAAPGSIATRNVLPWSNSHQKCFYHIAGIDIDTRQRRCGPLNSNIKLLIYLSSKHIQSQMIEIRYHINIKKIVMNIGCRREYCSACISTRLLMNFYSGRSQANDQMV